MRTEYINSLVVYFDDTEIEDLCTLSEKWKKQCNQVGLKRHYTPDEEEIIDRLYTLFDRKKTDKETQNANTQEIPVVGTGGRGKVR